MRQLATRGVFLFLASIILFTPTLFAQATINTVAGGGPDGISALHANLTAPTGVTVHNGELYLTAWHRVFRVDGAGVIHPFAGVGGDRTFGGDGLPALNGNLFFPGGIVFDDAGNLFIADKRNVRIRRVDAATGIITTVVPIGGNGSPVGLAADAAGNVYFADSLGNRVSRWDAVGGTVTPVAGTGACGSSGNGGPATSAQLCGPTHLALDRAAGVLYISDTQNNAVRKVSLASGTISQAASVPGAVGLALDPGAGYLYVGSASQDRIHRLEIATGVVTAFATVVPLDEFNPSGLALDGSGGLFAADGGSRVRRLNLSSLQLTVIAGNGSTFQSEDGFLPLQTWLYFPGSMTKNSNDIFYVSGQDNRIRVVDLDASTDTVSTL